MPLSEGKHDGVGLGSDARALARRFTAHASRFHFDDRLVVTYREDELRFPKDYIRARLAERAQDFENETGEKPTKAMLEAFEAGIRGELRRRLLPGTRLVDVVWDMPNQEVRIFTRNKDHSSDFKFFLSAPST